MDLTALPNGEINDTSPMAYAASCNPNILNHRDAMADDVEHFLESMDDEMKSLFKNKIYELYPRSKVLGGDPQVRLGFFGNRAEIRRDLSAAKCFS